MPRSTDSATATPPTPNSSDTPVQAQVKLKDKPKTPQPQSDAPSFYPSVTQESLMVEAIRRIEGKRRNQVPVPVENLQISKRVITVCNIDWILLDIWFDDASDPLFDGAVIWVKGYGAPNDMGLGEPGVGRQDTLAFHAMTTVNHSPATIFLIPTNARIVVGVESINNERVGSGLSAMPTQSFILST